jgi:hypothetical protein
MPESAMGRDLVKRYLERQSVERLPILLHLGPYAARLQQISYQQMCGDATLLANSMQGARRLFDCDGLILLADPTVEAEACGCEIEWRDDEPAVATHPLAGEDGPSVGLELGGIEGRGRLATLLEAARRLAAVIGRDLALMPAVAGPVTLASHLRGPMFWSDLVEAPERAYRVLEIAGQATLLVCRDYLDMGFEQLLVSDPKMGRIDPAHFPAIASALLPLGNVAEFYDAYVLLQTEIDDATRLEHLRNIGAHGLLVEGDTHLGLMARGANASDHPLGVGVPASLLEREPTDLEGALAVWRAETCPAGSLAVCFTIPRSTPPENLHTVLRILRG